MKNKWLVYVLTVIFMDAFGPAFCEPSDTGINSDCSRNFADDNTGPDLKNTSIVKNTGKSATPDKIIFSHSTYYDFSGGTVSNSGQNLFISGEGQIRFINWFDLNIDGHP